MRPSRLVLPAAGLVGLALILAACGGPADVVLNETQLSTAKAGARDVAERRGNWKFSSCSPQDSAKNGERPDGYVTCKISPTADPSKTEELQCSYNREGCK